MWCKKALLCHSLCPSILAFQFHSGFCLIPDLYAKFPAFYANNLPPYFSLLETHMGVSPYIIFVCSHRERAQCMNEGLAGGVVLVEKTLMWVCTCNYSSTQFITPIQGLILGPSPDLGPAGFWGDKLRRSCGSTTSRWRFRSGHLPNHVRVKWVPLFFRH